MMLKSFARQFETVDLGNGYGAVYIPLVVDEPTSFTVQGKVATSYEFNVAWALDKLELPYMFQFAFFGGRAVRGGIVVDFLVLTNPLSTPVWVNGGFWHQGKRASEDSYQQAVLYFVARGELNRPVTLWDPDCRTKEAALSAIRREFY